MKKIYISPRADKDIKLESIGFSFHNLDNYWEESRYYQFTQSQIDVLKKATNELHQMSLEAVDYVIKNKLMSSMGIPEIYHQSIIDSKGEPSFYGRFDFCYDGVNPPKMYEYNADTPISLLETSLAQKQWQKDTFPQYDQYNDLHQKMVDRWKEIGIKQATFTSLSSFEDMVCLNYIMQTAMQAGINCDMTIIDEIGYDGQSFTTDKPIENLFKIYPYEWLMEDSFGPLMIGNKTKMIEPMWKAILSNKAILPILYQMFPDSPYLIPTYYSPNGMDKYCKKPFFSREGSNIEVVAGRQSIITDGPYQSDSNIYQEYCELPFSDGYYAVIGSWVIGDVPAGMYIRETKEVVTGYMSHFIPHIIVD